MKRRLLAFLQQGLSPEALALCLALGLVLGVFPVLGSTTLLCFLAAWALRLNQPAIQSVNYLVYPLQLALLIPFFRLGDSLFGMPHLPLSLEGVQRLVASGWLHAIRTLWETTLRAVLVWFLMAPAVTWLLYQACLPVMRRLAKQNPA